MEPEVKADAGLFLFAQSAALLPRAHGSPHGKAVPDQPGTREPNRLTATG